MPICGVRKQKKEAKAGGEAKKPEGGKKGIEEKAETEVTPAGINREGEEEGADEGLTQEMIQKNWTGPELGPTGGPVM